VENLYLIAHQDDGSEAFGDRQNFQRPSSQCPRCGGLMVIDRFEDLLDDTDRLRFLGLRCLVYGEILDPLVLLNRGHMNPHALTE
jgi:hypothetical protein